MIKVFKIGGNVLDDNNATAGFCRDFASVEGPKVLVHGGGAFATQLQKQLGHEAVKIEGRRVTDGQTLRIVTMAYAGWCNKQLVCTLQKYGCNAIGLAGCDGNVIRASKRPPLTLSDGKTQVDFGFVGDVDKNSVNSGFLMKLLDSGLVPVICAINHDGNGQLLNTNADTVAAGIAASLGAELVLCFELDGVLKDKSDPSSVLESISEKEFKTLVSDGSIEGGMLPKLENCFKAINEGATGARITNAGKITVQSGTKIIK